MGVPEMAQNVFEGDVFSILIYREKIEDKKSPSKTFWAISGTPMYFDDKNQLWFLNRIQGTLE